MRQEKPHRTTALPLTKPGQRTRRMFFHRFTAALLSLLLTTSALGKGDAPGAGLLDLDGRAATPFHDPKAKLLVFLFTRADCPISNSYAPEIARLHAQFAPRGAVFWLVYCDPDETTPTIGKHLREFSYPCGALRDPSHRFAKKSRVKITPEAAVFQPDGALLYHGRIDDRHLDFGKTRHQPTRRELALAVTQALAGRAVTPATGPAIGCDIQGVK